MYHIVLAYARSLRDEVPVGQEGNRLVEVVGGGVCPTDRNWPAGLLSRCKCRAAVRIGIEKPPFSGGFILYFFQNGDLLLRKRAHLAFAKRFIQLNPTHRQTL